jgi:hypothetical protein
MTLNFVSAYLQAHTTTVYRALKRGQFSVFKLGKLAIQRRDD